MFFKTQLAGNLGQDATVNTTNSGKKAVNFSIAHSVSWKDSQGVQNQKTTWIDCTYWEKENLAQYLKKGIPVLVEGEIEADAYLDKQNKPQGKLKLRVTNLVFLPTAKKDDAAATSTTATEKKDDKLANVN